jgi:K+-sensing histidine kinase KdpD
MMDKYEILSIIAPIAAPAAPATMLINILYVDLLRESVNSGVAIGAAVLSGVGAEASGMIAAYVGVQAYRKQKYGLMMVAMVAFVVYAAFMAVGISSAKNPVSMVSTIIISVMAYVAVAMLTDLRSIIKDAQTETDNKIAVLEAERLLSNSRNRGLKLSTGGQTVGQTGRQSTQFVVDPALIAAIEAFWQANPSASLRDCAAAVGCSPMTAGKYKP